MFFCGIVSRENIILFIQDLFDKLILKCNINMIIPVFMLYSLKLLALMIAYDWTYLGLARNNFG